jgi:serine/threonine protein kinase
MSFADRTLDAIFRSEYPDKAQIRVFVEQLAEAVKHVHSKGVIHGDWKLQNVVRFGGRLRLIDLDAAVEIDSFAGAKYDSFAGAKYSSGVLPPEMIAQLTIDECELFQDYFIDANVDEWKQIRAKSSGDDTEFFVVKTLRTKDLEYSKKVLARDGRKFEMMPFTKHDDPVDKSKLPYELVKATAAIDIWSFGVILYTLDTGEPLFDVNRDNNINTVEAMKDLFEWDEHKRLTKLEEVNDPLARKLLKKILSKEAPERYQSMDELLKEDYFGFNNRTTTTDNASEGATTPEPGLVGLTIPPTISSKIELSESNAVHRKIMNLVNLVTTDVLKFYPGVIISYATGRRPASDVEGSGPGMLIAAVVIEALFNSGIPCFSGLMTPAGRNWEGYFLRLEHEDARVLVILLSKAFFQSLACLKEVHAALRNRLEIIPVRAEESETGASDTARDMGSMWPDALIEKDARSEYKNETTYLAKLEATKLQRLKVRDKLMNANTLPARGYVLTDGNALRDLINRVQGILN